LADLVYIILAETNFNDRILSFGFLKMSSNYPNTQKQMDDAVEGMTEDEDI
jgi:hypothetical protein